METDDSMAPLSPSVAGEVRGVQDELRGPLSAGPVRVLDEVLAHEDHHERCGDDRHGRERSTVPSEGSKKRRDSGRSVADLRPLVYWGADPSATSGDETWEARA